MLYIDQGIRLAPFYDILSTAIYPELSAKMAMKIGKVYPAVQVTFKEWEKMAEQCGLSVAMVRNRLKELAALLRKKVEIIELPRDDRPTIALIKKHLWQTTAAFLP